MRNIFLDLDGVLVDFVRGALEKHNKAIAPQDVRWNFHEQVGLSEDDFWRPLGYDFWATLPWTREGPALLHLMRETFGTRFGLLTSPANNLGCIDGKRSWVRSKLGSQWVKNLIFAQNKALFANPHALLIDDADHNVDAFRAANGRAILVPRPWNVRRAECDAHGHFNVNDLIREIWEEAV